MLNTPQCNLKPRGIIERIRTYKKTYPKVTSRLFKTFSVSKFRPYNCEVGSYVLLSCIKFSLHLQICEINITELTETACILR